MKWSFKSDWLLTSITIVGGCREGLTMLKLDLHFEVLPEQVHHYGFHMPTDATAVSARAGWMQDSLVVNV